MKTYFKFRQELNENKKKSNFASVLAATTLAAGLTGGGLAALERATTNKQDNQTQTTTAKQPETKQPQQQVTQQQNQQIKKPKTEFEEIADLVHGYESRGADYKKISGPFLDHKGNKTLGHGHLITDNSHKVLQKVFADEHKKDPNFHEKVLKGHQRLSHDQMKRLMHHDISTRIPEVHKLVPEYHKMPIYLKKQLFSEYYRGGLGGSPKAVAHINAGRFHDAAKEYINSNEYRTEKARKESSVAERFDNLHDALIKYHKETQGK